MAVPRRGASGRRYAGVVGAHSSVPHLAVPNETPRRSLEGTPVTSGVYVILNTANGKCYVGSSVNVRTRLLGHRKRLEKGSHGNRHLQRAWNMYGPEQFRFKVVNLCSKSCLVEEEQKLIDVLRSMDGRSGYNGRGAGPRGTLGIEGRAKLSLLRLGVPLNPEHREKLSVANKARAKDPVARARLREVHQTLEFRAKLSFALRGRSLRPEHYAKLLLINQSPERRAAVSAVHKGKVIGKETREKMSVSHQGMSLSADHCAAISAGLKGKPKTSEHRAALSSSLKRFCERKQNQCVY